MNEQIIELKLTTQQTSLVLAALSKLPYEVVCFLITNIEAQARKQTDNATVKE